MTTRQLRDIASYYGAPCSLRDNPIQPLGFYMLGHLQSSVDLGAPVNFRLHLRKIESLSDEEMRHCADLLGFYATSQPDIYPVIRDDHFLGCAGFYIRLPEGDIMIERSESCFNGHILAYLQSLHIHIPGTIDKELVTLL